MIKEPFREIRSIKKGTFRKTIIEGKTIHIVDFISLVRVIHSLTLNGGNSIHIKVYLH